MIFGDDADNNGGGGNSASGGGFDDDDDGDGGNGGDVAIGGVFDALFVSVMRGAPPMATMLPARPSTKEARPRGWSAEAGLRYTCAFVARVVALLRCG
jgi:hypothetical protein